MKPRFPHQSEIFEKTKDTHAFALEWEVRVGKTVPTIDTAIHLYERGEIDSAVIIAPNGVKLAWSRENIYEYRKELEDGRPDLNKNSKEVIDKSLIFEFQKSQSKIALQACEDAINWPGMVWFCINNEGIADRLNKDGVIVSSKVQAYLELFLSKRKAMLICDESHEFKHIESKRTKAMVRLSKLFTPYHRNLTGTPLSKPFDLWSQYHILDPMIIKTYADTPMKWPAFKQRFGIWKKTYVATHSFMALDTEQGDKGYKDLDHLYSLIDPYRSRLTKKEAFKDYKEPIYEKRLYEMPDSHRKVYNEMRDELITRLDSGEEISAPNKLVQMMRLKQISRGYIGGVEKGQVVPLGEPYPSIESLLKLLEELEEDEKIIIWCTMTPQVDLIIKSLTEKMIPCERYDGKVANEQRQVVLVRMREDPAVRIIVGTPAAGGVGVDMSFASTMIFYDFNYYYEERVQAIGRFEGPKQKFATLHLDLVCADTNDSLCLDALATKEGLADLLTGDSARFKKFLMGERK